MTRNGWQGNMDLRYRWPPARKLIPYQFALLLGCGLVRFSSDFTRFRGAMPKQGNADLRDFWLCAKVYSRLLLSYCLGMVLACFEWISDKRFSSETLPGLNDRGWTGLGCLRRFKKGPTDIYQGTDVFNSWGPAGSPRAPGFRGGGSAPATPSVILT